MLLPLALTLLAGASAGVLGALLGLGGGFVLVPFLEWVVGLPFATATGVSLATVIGTSVAVSTSPVGRALRNARLALLLQVCTVTGAAVGSELHRWGYAPDGLAKRLFAVTALLVAASLVARLDRRNVLRDNGDDPGSLGGRFFDDDLRVTVAYKVKRLPFAMGLSSVAGVLSSLTGLGGGVVVVPVLNSFCGVPLRVAAATSAAVIGVTAIPGVLEKFPINDARAPELAAAAVIGVLAGSRTGLWISGRVSVKWLKVLLAVILLIVAARYLMVAA